MRSGTHLKRQKIKLAHTNKMMGGGGGEYWVAKMGSLPEILTYNKLAYTDAISPVNIIQPKLQ